MTQREAPTTAQATTPVIVAFHLTDTGESFHVAAREGLVTVVPADRTGASATVRLPQRVWFGLVLGVTSLGEALLADGVDAAGDLGTFVRFHRRFATTGRPRRSRRPAEPTVAHTEES